MRSFVLVHIKLFAFYAAATIRTVPEAFWSRAVHVFVHPWSYTTVC